MALRRRCAVALRLLIVTMLVVGATQFAPFAHAAQPPAAGAVARLTPDGGTYAVTTLGSNVVVRNYCSGGKIAQNGIGFRIAPQSGGYNAIVLTRNIWLHLYWVFNATMFHTGSDYGDNKWEGPPGINLR